MHTDGVNVFQDDPDVNMSLTSLNMNHYANKKSAAESMLDIALFMANASQLQAVLLQGSQIKFYTALVTLIILSLCLQTLVGVLLLSAVRWNLNDSERQPQLDIMEDIITACIFIIVVINIFITAFGVHKLHKSP